MGCVENGSFSVMFTLFQALSVTGKGGGICCECGNAIVSLNGNAFFVCTATLYGGAIYISNAFNSSINRCCGERCYAVSHGQFLDVMVQNPNINSGPSVITQSSAIFCPRNYEGTHQTFRIEYGKPTISDVNSSLNYKKGHSSILCVYFSELKISFTSLCSSKTGIVLELWEGQTSVIESVVLRNNSYAYENMAVFLFNSGSHSLSNVICINNVFSNNYDIRNSPIVNFDQIFYNPITSYPDINDLYNSKGCVVIRDNTQMIIPKQGFLLLFIVQYING